MDFDTAAVKAKTLKSSPSNDELLEMYALFKQGTIGDCSGARPGMFDPKGRAKYDAWEKIKGMSQEDAKEKYIAVVQGLIDKYGTQ
eukprot:Clim_evm31s215 gene=Clim_evmTU31s215